MAFHNELGMKGEDMAAQYMKNKGYAIIERNWRYGNLEIDLIVRNNTEIVFVEVKTRSDDAFARPEDAVDWNKRRHLTIAASHYMSYTRCNLEPRFDVIAIVCNPTRTDIQHYENAFPPVHRPRRYR